MRRGLSIAAGPRDTQDPVQRKREETGTSLILLSFPPPPPEQGVPGLQPALIPAHGLPCLVSASSNVSTQNAASRVIDTRHDRTRRLNHGQVDKATRHRDVGISIAHT